jgi:hypothetical protein
VSASVKRAKRLARLVVVALFLIGVGSSKTHPTLLLAQDTNPPPQDMPFTVTGNIIDHSPGKITISSGQNMEFDVKYDSKTEIQHQDGSPAKDSDLKIGIDIQVKGLLTEAGDIIAQKIVIQAKTEGSTK